jgi:replication-associated recombination protein RarA
MAGAFRFAEQITPGGYRCDEASSALQKSIRRGLEADAIYWASELDIAGYAGYCWRRLRLICSEDVGLAWIEGPSVIAALYDAWLETTKREKAGRGVGNGALFLTHAVIALARAPKSRIVDNAVNLFYSHREAVRRDLPDYALDAHTARGRTLGRTEKTTYDTSYGIVQTLSDPYVGPAHPWMSPEQVRRHAEPDER